MAVGTSCIPVIELRSVSKLFGPVKAVDDVSLQIWDGEFFSMLGPSGCGKTTTLRMIGGFEFPDAGEVLIGGERMGMKPANARPTNMVFQRLALFPHLSVYDNVAFGLRMKRVKEFQIREAVGKALEMVRLTGFERRRISQLSGGQQQRVALARAIVNRPKVLLLDEPLASLDLKLRIEMQLELKKLQKELGTTFVYVTHDQGEALLLSDRIAVMNAGRIVQLGGPHEIYESPACAFVAKFIGDTNLLTGRVEEVGARHVWVNCGGLTLESVNPGGVNPGDGVSVSIRYERVRLCPNCAAGSAANAFKGTVKAVTYLGSFTRYEVEIPGCQRVTAQLAGEGGGAGGYSVGDDVTVEWEPESAIVLRE